MAPKLTVSSDLTFLFGDRNDGVIGLPVLTGDGQVVEASYFFGRAKPKNIIVVSTQAGCPMGCSFCELGSERFVRDLTAEEIVDQVRLVLARAAGQGFGLAGRPHKITMANCGEPLLNPQLPAALERLADLDCSFKVSTVFPRARSADRALERLAAFAASYGQSVQMQVSLISTDQAVRRDSRHGRVADFDRIRWLGEMWRRRVPGGRRVNLTLLLTEDVPCDAGQAVRLFPPELFRFRFREYVPTRVGVDHGLKGMTVGRMAQVKEEFAAQGYLVGDWASPTPTERRFGLVGTAIRRMYLDIVSRGMAPAAG